MKNYFAGTLLVLMSASAFAQSPSYDYFQLTWQTIEFDDGIDVDGDGLGLSGSVEVADNWHVFAGYSDIGLDFGIDLTEFAVGGGYHTDISPNTSVFADLAWVTAEIDSGIGGAFDESGYGAAVGIRSNVTEQVELAASISYVDLGDGADGTSFGVGAWYQFTDAFSLGLIGDFEDDVSSFGIGGRFYF